MKVKHEVTNYQKAYHDLTKHS